MTSSTYVHTPINVEPDTHINAPMNAHGWCFGLIPANGSWLDDIIDWQKRQFRQAAVARRMAACWNACSQLSTEYLEQNVDHQAKPEESPTSERSRHVASVAAGIRSALSAARAAKVAPGQHADDIAVDWFADALKEKLAEQRAKGYDRWEDTIRCPTERLQAMLVDHVGKGDPVDVGNFAMMLWNRGENTTAAPVAQRPANQSVRAASEWALVMEEVARATSKFPTWPTDPLHAVAVLGEEFGELTKAVLQTTYEPHKVAEGELRMEAIQTAAMSLRFLASLGTYEFTKCLQHEQAKATSPVSPKLEQS